MRVFYLACFVAGCALTLSRFAPSVARDGLAPPLPARETGATPMGRFARLDVVGAAVALLGWIAVDTVRGRARRWWLPARFTVIVGVSAGLPLHLYLRASGHGPVDSRTCRS